MPARFPNLLVNGSGGIAVGMATNIPPHNLGEVIDGCIALIDNPAIELAELMDIIPGPDFPTGGIILVAPASIPPTRPDAVLLSCADAPPSSRCAATVKPSSSPRSRIR
jgi:hypothetical protein